MKRLVCLLLAVIVCIGLFAACGKNNDPEVPTASGEESTAPQSDSGEHKPQKEYHSETNYEPEIQNFGGYQYIIATNDRDPVYECIVPDGSEVTSIPIAVFRRNSYVEKLYGVEIVERNQLRNNNGEAQAYIENMDKTGEYYADIFSYYCLNLMNMTQGGYFKNIFDSEKLNLSGEWWDQNFIDTLNIDGHAYMLTGDMQTDDEIHQIALMANNTLFSQFFPEKSLYDDVINDAWTLETFFNYWKGFGNDSNGNFVLDPGERIGYCYDNLTFSYFFISANINLIQIDKTGDGYEVKSNISSEKSTTLVGKLSDILKRCNTDTIRATQNAEFSYGGVRNAFLGGNMLFITNNLGDAIGYYLDSANDIYYLPYPKYDTDQLIYRTPVHAYFEPWSIPRTVTDFEKTCLITEALCYYSEKLTDTVRNTVIQTRLSTDPKAMKLVQVLTESKAYDLEYITNISGINSMLSEMVRNGNTDTYTSDAEGIAKSSIKKVNQFLLGYTAS